ncbi:MAG: aromatic amino acid lyase [Planctomycetes bacterium]|nr:aromatic amino acid lyase [Planctomycetota bacterium]
MVKRGPAAFDPAEIDEVVLDGTALGIAEVIAVARLRRPVSIAPQAKHRVDCCRKMIDLLLERREKIYGLTTGFGKLRDVTIQGKDVQRLQINLIRSHACGVGEPFDEDVVRAALLLRANTLCRGNSGIRNETLNAVVQLLNAGIYPYVPTQGSVGASGDLAPLSHMALVVMGDPGGRFFPRASRVGTEIVKGARAEDFVACGALDWREAALGGGETFAPVTLQAKEGLALNNGTQFMSALGCLLLYDAGILMEWAELGVAMCLEAERGVRHAFQPELHLVRDLSYQGDTAARILAHVEGSEILDVLINTAYLQRSRHPLREARHHLETAAAETAPESEQRERAEDAQARIEALLGAIGDLVPEGAVAPPENLLASRDLTFRAQIPIYEGVLDSLRREATGLLSFLDQPSFPRTPLMRESAVRFLETLEMAVPSAPPVQDDYSLRCSPQVLACGHRALAHVLEVLEVEINSATDNPLLFPPKPPGGFDSMDAAAYAEWLRDPAQADGLADRVLGGGNFHGEPIGLVLDYLAMAIAEVGNISERRIAHMVDASLSNGLPPFLMEGSGLNSGFMVPQYTAASLVSENKVLCHPATTDSIPTCAGSEDHVSMGTIAARKAIRILENVANVVAIEILAAFQGLSFRAPLRPGGNVAAICAHLRDQGMRPMTDDRVLYPDIHRVRDLLRERPHLEG